MPGNVRQNSAVSSKPGRALISVQSDYIILLSVKSEGQPKQQTSIAVPFIQREEQVQITNLFADSIHFSSIERCIITDCVVCLSDNSSNALTCIKVKCE